MRCHVGEIKRGGRTDIPLDTKGIRESTGTLRDLGNWGQVEIEVRAETDLGMVDSVSRVVLDEPRGVGGTGGAEGGGRGVEDELGDGEVVWDGGEGGGDGVKLGHGKRDGTRSGCIQSYHGWRARENNRDKQSGRTDPQPNPLIYMQSGFSENFLEQIVNLLQGLGRIPMLVGKKKRKRKFPKKEGSDWRGVCDHLLTIVDGVVVNFCLRDYDNLMRFPRQIGRTTGTNKQPHGRGRGGG